MKKLGSLTQKEAMQSAREYGGIKSPSSVKKDYGFFGEVLKKKRLEVITPRMHYLDTSVIEELYEDDMLEKYPDMYNEVFVNKKIAKVPDNILHDLFQLHLMRTMDVTMELSEVNTGSYGLIKKMNDVDMKMITNSSAMNSYVMAKNIMFDLQRKLMQEDEKPPQDQGEGGEGDDNIADKLSSMLDKGSNGGKDPMASAKDSAKKEIEEMESSQDILDELSEGGGDAGSGTIRNVAEHVVNKKLLKGIDMSNRVLADMLKHSLESSVNYFTASFTEFRESVFESEDISEVMGVEYILPVFRNLLLDNIETVSRKYKMAIDVYIDVSGSMSSSMRMGKNDISFLDISKLLALKISSKKILKDIYIFDDQISGPITKKDLMQTGICGGTNLTRVIEHIKASGRPSVIITDAQDSIYEYSDLAYFIGVGNPSIRGTADVIQKFRSNNQGIEYRSDNTFGPIKFNC